MPVPVAQRCLYKLHVSDTIVVAEGDWLNDKDSTTWLTDKVYRTEVGEPRTWTMAVTYVVSPLTKMKKCESTKATHGGLA